METIGELVLEHVKERIGSTGRALELLGLEKKSENFAAGNVYLAALEIIRKLKNRLGEEI